VALSRVVAVRDLAFFAVALAVLRAFSLVLGAGAIGALALVDGLDFRVGGLVASSFGTAWPLPRVTTRIRRGD
jgi:hypothetical protein